MSTTTTTDPQPLVAKSTRELRELYLHDTERIRTIAAHLDIVKETIRDRVEPDKPLDAADGYAFVLEKRQSREYSKPTLRKYLDEDQIETVLKPDTKKVKELLKSLKLTPEAQTELESTMLVVSESEALKLKEPKP